MASITLYTQPDEGAQQTYQMGTFTIQDLVKGTDYTEDRLTQIYMATAQKNIYALKLSINIGGVINLDVNKRNMPIPSTSFVQPDAEDPHMFATDLCDTQAQALSTRPADWDLHWRDKYNPRQPDNIGQEYFVPALNPGAPTSGGVPYERVFASEQYFETNPSRWLFWTQGGSYFALENIWRKVTVGQAFRLQNAVRAFSIGDYNMGSPNYSAGFRYVNSIRENGVQGPYLFTQQTDVNAFQLNMTHTYTTVGQQLPYVFLNFIQFEYPVEQQSGEITQEEFIGICGWEEGLDTTPQRAAIVAFSKAFWTGRIKPAYTGPTSSVQGGSGIFSRNSQTGGLDGSTVASTWNSAISNFTSGFNKFVVYNNDTASNSALQMFTEHIVSPADWSQAFENKLASPLNATIAYHLMPFRLAPDRNGTSKPISAGGVIFTQIPMSGEYLTATCFSDDYAYYDIGSVAIPEDTGSFADYTNTSVLINLPYIGVYDIDVSACMGGSIYVSYISEAFSGDCVAFVTVTDRNGIEWTRYSWKGNCSKPIPLATYEPVGARIAGGIMKTGLSVGVGALTGNIATGIIAGGLATNIENMKDYFNPADDPTDYRALATELLPQNAGTIANTAGALSTLGNNVSSALQTGATTTSNAAGTKVSTPVDTRCWVLYVKPEWSNPDYYARECGYPSDIEGRVDDFEGLLSVSSIELDGIDCTDYERHEIQEAMRAGVYLNDRRE